MNAILNTPRALAMEPSLLEHIHDRTYADFLIECIALQVAEIHDPRDRLARQVGMLQGELRRVWAMFDELRPDDSEAEALQA